MEEINHISSSSFFNHQKEKFSTENSKNKKNTKEMTSEEIIKECQIEFNRQRDIGLIDIFSKLQEVISKERKRIESRSKNHYISENTEVINTKLKKLKNIESIIYKQASIFNEWYELNTDNNNLKKLDELSEEDYSIIRQKLVKQIELIRNETGNYLNKYGNEHSNYIWQFISKSLEKIGIDLCTKTIKNFKEINNIYIDCRIPVIAIGIFDKYLKEKIYISEKNPETRMANWKNKLMNKNDIYNQVTDSENKLNLFTSAEINKNLAYIKLKY